MYEMSQYTFAAGFLAVALASAAYLWHLLGARAARSRLATAAGPDLGTVTAGATARSGRYATILTVNALLFLSLSLIFRAVATGHGPFSNMYEFSVAFSWGITASYLYFETRYGARPLGAFAMPAALGLLWYASTVPSTIQPLVPALQNDLLLTVHVVAAITAYGMAAVSGAAAALYLIQAFWRRDWLPRAGLLDELGYRAAAIAFPLLAAMIILGALWADVAWGRYWSWDPKETASLVTWLLYGGYLHARVVRGWKGTRSAVLLLIGFGAVLFTYYGNLYFGGLHSYAGVN